MLNIILVFTQSGWCEKINKSYFKGRYQPKNKEEFEALKQFASEVITLGDTEKVKEKISSENLLTTETEKEFTEEHISELRAKAKEAKIHNWHSKNPNTLIKELGIEI